MDMNQARYFLAAAELKNLKLAAEKLHVSRAAISKSLTKLEQEIGLNLFSRSVRGMQLTDDGQALLPAMKNLLKAYSNLENVIESRNRNSQVIHLGCTYGASSMLFGAIERFEKKYPGFEIEIKECQYDFFPEMITDENFHIGISPVVFRNLRNTVSFPIMMSELLWGVPASSDIAKRGFITEEEVYSSVRLIASGGNLVTCADDTIYVRDERGNYLIDHKPFTCRQSDNIFHLAQLVRRGKGILSLANHAEKPELEGITLVHSSGKTWFWVLYCYMKEESLTPYEKSFMKEVMADADHPGIKQMINGK